VNPRILFAGESPHRHSRNEELSSMAWRGRKRRNHALERRCYECFLFCYSAAIRIKTRDILEAALKDTKKARRIQLLYSTNIAKTVTASKSNNQGLLSGFGIQIILMSIMDFIWFRYVRLAHSAPLYAIKNENS
jgi:hypothetical protein